MSQITLWCFVLVLQYYAGEVNCQLHVEVRNYLYPFSSLIDTHTTAYEFNEPDLSWGLNHEWFNFYPYANIEQHFTGFTAGSSNSNLSGYLYNILDCDEIEDPNSDNIRLPPSHNLWFAFINNYSQNCHSGTTARLKGRGYYMLFAYNSDGDQTISQEDKDSGFPVALLTESHALDLLSYYSNVNYSSGINSDIPVIFITRTEDDRIYSIIVSVAFYIIASFFGLCGLIAGGIFGIVMFVLSCNRICQAVRNQLDARDDAPANNIELRNVSQRDRERIVDGVNGVQLERETRINMENVNLRKYDPQNDSQQTCIICLEDFTTGENVRCLDCDQNHIFHSHCLSKWFRRGDKSCPLCRAKSK